MMQTVLYKCNLSKINSKSWNILKGLKNSKLGNFIIINSSIETPLYNI